VRTYTLTSFGGGAWRVLDEFHSMLRRHASLGVSACHVSKEMVKGTDRDVKCFFNKVNEAVREGLQGIVIADLELAGLR
jgi:hypothetical protein